MTPPLSVVSPALRFPSGEVLAPLTDEGGPVYFSHDKLIAAAFATKRPGGEPLYDPGCEPGFMLSNGDFAPRYAAQLVARQAGQLSRRDEHSPLGLQSHHLWDEDGRPLWEAA